MMTWEEMLMVDPGAEEWRRDEERARARAIEAREASDQYARDNGYDVNPITGQYLAPKGAE